MTEVPTAPHEPAAPASKARGRESVGDMVRSLSLVLVVVAVVLLLTLRDDPEQAVQRVDFRENLRQARQAAPYAVLAPAGLGARWKATSVRDDDEGGAMTWHIGFVTPDARYAAVEQSDGPVKAFVEAFVGGARKSGDVTVSGATWQRLEGGKPEPRALVLRGRGVTTVVTGTAGFAELQQLAMALRGG